MNLDVELYRKNIVVPGDPGFKLSVIDIHPQGAQKTILFIHGFAGRATMWEHQIRRFSDDYRVIALDMRGHGQSDQPDSQYTMEELLADLTHVLSALGVEERFVLAAHSFGGAVALEYAKRHPEQIERLILFSTTTDFSHIPLVRFFFWLPSSILEIIRKIFPRQLNAPAGVLKKLYKNTLRTWRGDFLSTINVPTHVVYGHRDALFSKSAYSEVGEKLPTAQTTVIPVSSHLVILERPEAVNRAIERSLEPREDPLRPARKARPKVEYPWLKHYEEGVPYTVCLPSQPLHSFLESSARRHPKSTAIIFYGRKMSYRSLNEASSRFANALINIGVKKGDRVLILLPNIPQSVICFFGVLKAGAISVFSNPLFDEEELMRQIEVSNSETLVTLTLYSALAKKALSRGVLKHVVLANIKEYLPLGRMMLFTLFREKKEGHRPTLESDPRIYSLQDLLTKYNPLEERMDVGQDDVAVIQYTGGTTDKPKGTMLTHMNLTANTIQIRHWITDAKEGRERFLCVIPFSHIYGLTTCMNLPVFLASAMILLPTFNTNEVLKTIASSKPTLFPGVPTMYVVLADHPNVKRFSLKSIRACVSGAAPLPIEVQEAFEKLTHAKVVEGYGLTEASPVTHVNPLSGLRKPGTIGVPVPGTEAKVISIQDGSNLGPGELGELVVRGPQVMKGYWGLPEESSKALADGWLHTGDIARVDEDGYFQIIDRKKDMIIAGDYNVYPRYVEEVLYEHPKILEAAVAGFPPEQKNQIVKAFVVLKKGERSSPEEIIRFCQSRLRGYEVPREVEFKASLPKSFIGKVLRRVLTEVGRR